MRLDDMANIDLESQTTLKEPLLAFELPSDPTSWTRADLRQWLHHEAGGRFADLIGKLAEVDGRQICFMSEKQLVDILGGRGSALYGHVKAARKAQQLTLNSGPDKLPSSSSSPSKTQPTGAFPPIFYIPSLKFMLIALTLITTCVLLLTVGSESLETLFQAGEPPSGNKLNMTQTHHFN